MGNRAWSRHAIEERVARRGGNRLNVSFVPTTQYQSSGTAWLLQSEPTTAIGDGATPLAHVGLSGIFQ